MPMELTEQQQRALDTLGGTPARIVDPRTKAAYVLVREPAYESFCEWLEDERQQRAIRGGMALVSRRFWVPLVVFYQCLHPFGTEHW